MSIIGRHTAADLEALHIGHYRGQRHLVSERFRAIPRTIGDIRRHSWGVRRPMLCRDRRTIMMYPLSPSPRQLVVPGIGFPQSISLGPNGPYPEVLRDWSTPTQGRKTNDAPMQ